MRTPVIFQVVLLFVLFGLAAFGFWQFTRAPGDSQSLIFFLSGTVALLITPWLVYRLISLYRSFYTVQRDGIRLQWGLRVEDIPMDRIEWITPVADLEGKLPLPLIRWPGSIIGVRKLPDGSTVEFMSSSLENLVLISVRDRYFAISPADPQGLVNAYQKFTELGSVTPLPSRSVYPSFLLARFWGERLARAMFLSGLVLSLVLFAWVMLIIPTRPEIPLRLDEVGAGIESAPSVRLLLLPVLSLLIFAADFLVGLFFYRLPEGRAAAFLFWLSGILTPVLFLFAVGFIQRAS